MNDQSTFSADEIRFGEQLFSGHWDFVKGVPALDVLPPADRVEFAFAGRSNVGKSSLLNALVNRRDLARTSNTPGRTQEINFFRPSDAGMYLVDMPGYGFAKAPKDKVAAWTGLVRDYLRGRPTLARVFLLIDARHGIKPVDAEIMDMLDTAAVSYQVILTKADKISMSALEAMTADTQRALKTHPAAHPAIIATSSQTSQGIECVRAAVGTLLSQTTAHRQR
jgi:GTP-binding protein